MPATKERRVRFCTRLTLETRNRLTKYCAASGIAERSVVETALEQFLQGTNDRALLLTRFDQLANARAEDHRSSWHAEDGTGSSPSCVLDFDSGFL